MKIDAYLTPTKRHTALQCLDSDQLSELTEAFGLEV